MKTLPNELAAYFALLADDELLRQSQKELTSEARVLVSNELRSRGFPVPEVREPACLITDIGIQNSDDDSPEIVDIAQLQDLTEAHLLKGYLENLGIPALVMGADVARTFSNVLGGTRLGVPKAFVTQAREIVDKYNNDEGQLDEAPEIAARGQTDEHPNKGLKTYRVYAHPERKTLIVVKTGFCWAALLFGPLWFLLNKMWINALIFISLIVGDSLYFAHAQPISSIDVHIADAMAILYPVVWFLFSLFANNLLCADLESRGYSLRATVKARNPTYAREEARHTTVSRYTR